MTYEHDESMELVEAVASLEERLRLLWGTPEGSAYLRELTISDREGRQGFPPEVFRALNALVLLHPERAANGDAWGSSRWRSHG